MGSKNLAPTSYIQVQRLSEPCANLIPHPHNNPVRVGKGGKGPQMTRYLKLDLPNPVYP